MTYQIEFKPRALKDLEAAVRDRACPGIVRPGWLKHYKTIWTVT